MTPAAIALIEAQIQAARKRGDGREVGRLRADLPFEERQRVFGFWTTAVGRGNSLPVAGIEGGTPKSPSSHTRLIRDDLSKPTVAISQAVLKRIKEMRTDAEDGFWLVGPASKDFRVIQCQRAIWRPREEDRAPTSIQITFDELEQIDEGLRDGRGSRECVVAHLHSQPTRSDPSPQDMKVWADALDFSGRDVFAGLVMRAWMGGAMDLQAFVFSKENGETVHRKATIYVRS